MRARPSSELPAPDIAYEACDTFDADVAEPAICAGCGWLDDEHAAFGVATAA